MTNTAGTRSTATEVALCQHHPANIRQTLLQYNSRHSEKTFEFGAFQVLCHCWRPKGDFREELSRHFVGGGLQLRSLAVLAEPSQSAQLRTVAAGTVELRLAIVTRHFDRFGILC
jgi:hypothetical protein